MDAQQWLELLLKEVRPGRENRINQAKMDANMKAWREEMAAMRNKCANDNHNETLACQEMEARPEEKPISVDRKPEKAEEREVPEENAEVIPVGEPKKKRRRDRKLAAERRCQKRKTSTLENCGPPKELAVARRGTIRRAKMARKTPIDRKMSRRATVARRKRDIVKSYLPQEKCRPRKELIISRTWTSHRATVARQNDKKSGKMSRRATVARRSRDTLAPNMTRRAKVARRRRHIVGNNQTRKNVAGGTLRSRRLQAQPEGNTGTKDEHTRRRLHPRNERTASQTLRKTLRLNIRQQAIKIPSRSQIKNWTLWRGRPPPKRRKVNGLFGRNRW
jgi:hypothetical protein